MSVEQPIRPSIDEIDLLLLWRPKGIVQIDVLNKQNDKMLKVALDVVSNGASCVLHPNGKLHTLEDLQTALARLGKKFSISHIKNKLDIAREKFGTKQWLFCTFKSWIYHSETILKFLEMEDSFEIFRRQDRDPYQIKYRILNDYWRSSGMPFAYVRKKIILEEA